MDGSAAHLPSGTTRELHRSGYGPSVGDLTPGVYEHLLTEVLHGRLAGRDSELVSLGELDPIDAHETLTRHIAELAS